MTSYEQRYSNEGLIVPNDLPDLASDDSNDEFSDELSDDSSDYSNEEAIPATTAPTFNPDDWAGDYYYDDINSINDNHATNQYAPIMPMSIRPNPIIQQIMGISQLGLSPMDLARALLQFAASGMQSDDTNDNDTNDNDDNNANDNIE